MFHPPNDVCQRRNALFLDKHNKKDAQEQFSEMFGIPELMHLKNVSSGIWIRSNQDVDTGLVWLAQIWQQFVIYFPPENHSNSSTNCFFIWNAVMLSYLFGRFADNFGTFSLCIRPSEKPQEKLTLPLAKNTTRRVRLPVCPCVFVCMTMAIRGRPVPLCITILVTRKSAQSRNWHSWYVPSRTALQRNAFNYRNRNAPEPASGATHWNI